MLTRITSIYIALLLTIFLLAVPINSGYTAIAEFKYGLFLVICGGYVLTVAVLRTMYAITGQGDGSFVAREKNDVENNSRQKNRPPVLPGWVFVIAYIVRKTATVKT